MTEKHSDPPLISVIVPSLHEGPVINGLLAHLASLPGRERCEVIVVDGDPLGDTVATMDPVFGATGTVAGRGRARQMNAGAALARSGILLFLHSDTRLPVNGIERILAAMQDGALLGGAFDLGIASGKRRYRLIERIASWRSRATRLPFGDQAIFVRQKTFRELGGYSDIPIMEDVDFMRRLKTMKGKIFIVPERVSTSPRRWEKEGVVRCTLRNWLIQLLYAAGTAPERLARFYR